MTEEPFTPGILRMHMMSVKEKGVARSDKALMSLALRVLNKAREKVVEGGSHSPGTHTPAALGRGPAKVSGQLRQSLDKEVIDSRSGVLKIRVGTKATVRRPTASSTAHRERGSLMGRRKKGARSSTNADVGAALELGKRAHYPFLKPAFEEATRNHADTFKAAFAEGDWH